MTVSKPYRVISLIFLGLLGLSLATHTRQEKMEKVLLALPSDSDSDIFNRVQRITRAAAETESEQLAFRVTEDEWYVDLSTGRLDITPGMLELSGLLQNVANEAAHIVAHTMGVNHTPPQSTNLDILGGHHIENIKIILELHKRVVQADSRITVKQKINHIITMLNEDLHCRPEDIPLLIKCAHDLQLQGDKSVLYALAHKACEVINKKVFLVPTNISPALAKEIALANTIMGIPRLQDCQGKKLHRNLYLTTLDELKCRGYEPNIREQNGEVVLDLSKLNLTTLDGLSEISGIERVTTLDISQNQLNKIAHHVSNLHQLRNLRVQGNQISEFDWLYNLPGLKHLEVDPAVRNDALRYLKSLNHSFRQEIMVNEMKLEDWIKLNRSPISFTGSPTRSPNHANNNNSPEEIQRRQARIGRIKRSLFSKDKDQKRRKTDDQTDGHDDPMQE